MGTQAHTAEGDDRTWDTNHGGYQAIFNAALTGICANPAFFGAVFQGDPRAAVEFADRVVLAAITARRGGTGRGPEVTP